MDVPPLIAASHVVLTLAALFILLPDDFERPTGKQLRRLASKYGKFVLPIAIVAIAHLLLLSLLADDSLARAGRALDRVSTDALGERIAAAESPILSRLPEVWTGPTTLAASAVYFVLAPFVAYFLPFLFMLTDEERAAKAALLAFPLAYALALPFLIFTPVAAPFTVLSIPTPLFEAFPDARELYYGLATPVSAFPSTLVAIALLLANASRTSRNTRARYLAFTVAALAIAAPLYLGLHWTADVAAGALIAAVVGVFTNRVISVERLALQRIKPDPEEAQAIQDAAEALVAATRERLVEVGLEGGEPMLVGSVAKETYLRTKVDFDVFVLVPPTVSREDLESKGLALGRSLLEDPIEKFAEHPYIHGRWRRWAADLVPAYKVASPADRMSAVDRTPFHTRYVLERMERDQRDQVRLLKQFATGIGVYGAEAKTRGLSGYLCELLVLKFRTFSGVVRAGAGWKPGTFLALETIEGNPKFSDPLVFLDPVDARRNAASAVSAEKLALFAEACRGYLHREGLSFFFPAQLVPHNPEELERVIKRRRGDFILVSFPRPDVLEDHLYDQLRKAAHAVANLLERHEFEVKKWTTDVEDEARILVEVAHLRLSDAVVHAGPPVKSKEHVARFRKTWEGNADAVSPVYEEEGRLKVKRLREFRRADDLVRAKLLTVDLGKHLNAAARERFTVLSGPEVVGESTARIVTRHVTRKKPWEQ